MVPVVYDNVHVAIAATGTGAVTPGAALARRRTFAQAGVANGDVVPYRIDDGLAWEIGTGTYDSGAGTLTRTLDVSSTGALLNLSGSATLAIVARAAELVRTNPGARRRTVTDAAYTVTAADWGYLLKFTFAGDVCVYVPNGLGDGFGCSLVNETTGAVSVFGAGTATVAAGGDDRSLTATHRKADLVPIATDSYVLERGDGDVAHAIDAALFDDAAASGLYHYFLA